MVDTLHDLGLQILINAKKKKKKYNKKEILKFRIQGMIPDAH
jgi:hypothetical protein